MLRLAVEAGVFTTVLVFVIYWLQQGRRLTKESGYPTPRPTFWARCIIYVVSRLVSVMKVGKVTIVDTPGWRKAVADEKKVRYVVVANHQLFQDAVVLGKLSKLRRWRFMVAIEEVRRALLAPLYAMVGAIPVMRRDPKAQVDRKGTMREAANAVLGSVKALVSDGRFAWKRLAINLWLIALAGAAFVAGLKWLTVLFGIFALLGLIGLLERRLTHFLIFPQGRLVKDDVLLREDFQSGPIKVAKRVVKEEGGEVAILPIHIHYHYDAAHAGVFERFLDRRHISRTFFGYGPVYGSIVRIGEPLRVADLPTKDEEATDLLYESMLALQKASQDEYPKPTAAVSADATVPPAQS